MTVSLDKGHWHVAFGIAGYGPSADSFSVAVTPRELATLVEQELHYTADEEHEFADILAESGEFEKAWATLIRSRNLDILARNLSPSRLATPLYRDNYAGWVAQQAQRIRETFPLDVSDSGRLYVWECGESGCDQDQD